MTRNQKRLLTSFMISLGCMIATHVWYRSSSIAIDYGDRQPLAVLMESVNEVQRKPLKRLIWQQLTDNDQLYGGEQIRTTANSEARIQIIKTGTIIDLEPESLIVLEESDGELALDFLAGNLFVKGGTGGDNLKLKSGDKEIALGGAEVSLGRGAAGGVDVQVFKGSVDGINAAADPFDIVGPAPHAEVHISLDGKDKVTFEWKRQFAANTNIVLEIGKTRTELKARPDSEFKGNKVLTGLSPGDYFWRLVAQDPANPQAPVVSKTYRVKVLPKRPPVPLLPEKDIALVVPEKDPRVTFKWANPGKLAGVEVEISDTEDFKKVQKETSEKDLLDIVMKQSGTYYWRVVGYIGEKKERVVSAPQKFNLRVGGELAPPVLELPTKGEKVSFDQLQKKGVFLQWKPAGGAKGYKVIVKEKSQRNTAAAPREETVPVPQIRFNDLKPGIYEWHVLSIGENEKESKPSEVWNFSVDQIPLLAWKDSKTSDVHYYITEKPELAVGWVSGPKATTKYRLHLRKEAEGGDKSVSALFETTDAKSQVPTDGRYVASVEALNKDGVVLAKTPDRLVEVKAAPLLQAPVFTETLPNPLKASRNGGVAVEWKSVEMAKGYVVEMKNEKGEVVKQENTTGTRVDMRKLKPGDYQVTVQAVDPGGRRGVASEARPLNVPQTSDVRAPKMMKIKVE